MTKEEIIANYLHFEEDDRLKTPYGMLEEEHTRRLILKNIPSPASVIFDIGAGTGHYSAWLAALGYNVHFSDIVPKHVETFQSRHGNSKKILSIGLEDTRNLSYSEHEADVVILNGPLYHLPEREDRLLALREANRILRPGGRLLGFAISRFAGLHYALASGDIFNDDYFEMMKSEIKTGIRNNDTLKVKTFLKAYFHNLEELESEFRDSAFAVESSVGVLGPVGNMPDLKQAIVDPAKKERLLMISEMMEPYPMQSPKIMVIGIKR